MVSIPHLQPTLSCRIPCCGSKQVRCSSPLLQLKQPAAARRGCGGRLVSCGRCSCRRLHRELYSIAPLGPDACAAAWAVLAVNGPVTIGCSGAPNQRLERQVGRALCVDKAKGCLAERRHCQRRLKLVLEGLDPVGRQQVDRRLNEGWAKVRQCGCLADIASHDIIDDRLLCKLAKLAVAKAHRGETDRKPHNASFQVPHHCRLPPNLGDQPCVPTIAPAKWDACRTLLHPQADALNPGQ
mmetsp:Transcript_33628/g.84728  ORF Transcript_33628/g.84728 Transcript_33628/m.84728 type:complete len:240 (+) Transcript_33628:927-1646(+)